MRSLKLIFQGFFCLELNRQVRRNFKINDFSCKKSYTFMISK